MNTSFSYEISGKYALFTDPITKVGGEKFSYPIPTYQALIGITERIYWKPTIEWVIDKVRIMNQIDMTAVGMRPIRYNESKNDLSYYTYLTDVKYQVQVHFKWNFARPDLEQDRDYNKHISIMKRALESGGRFPVFLGTSECAADVQPCVFGAGKGAYDGCNMAFGVMVHGITYPDNVNSGSKMYVRLWSPKMENGVIQFIKPEECQIVKEINQTKVR